ncbi:MAG: lipopolysaccharide export system protein LptA [Paraglaciecola sp.]|jgi:lipopolysaccharide export system protein LptA
MCKPFINLVLNTLVLGVLIFSTAAMAGKDDFTQAIKVDSKYQFGDGITKKSVFREDVHISQGSLHVYADEVEVDASQGEGQEIFIATGAPATYSQQQEQGGAVVASANRIVYRRDERTLSLNGGAELKQDNSSVKGESIVFNMALEQIVAQGENEENSRVITIFQPQKKPGKVKSDTPVEPSKDEQP